MKTPVLLLLLLAFVATTSVSAQEVSISDLAVDATGRVQIQVASSSDYYYVLFFREDLQSDSEKPVSMALGENGTTTLTEQLKAYPEEHYRVVQYLLSAPDDIDGDGTVTLNDFRMLSANFGHEMELRAPSGECGDNSASN